LHRSSASLFDSLSDASGVNLNRDDESALEAGSLASVEPETPRFVTTELAMTSSNCSHRQSFDVHASAMHRETYQETIQQLAVAKSSKAKSHTAEVHTLHRKSNAAANVSC